MGTKTMKGQLAVRMPGMLLMMRLKRRRRCDRISRRVSKRGWHSISLRRAARQQMLIRAQVARQPLRRVGISKHQSVGASKIRGMPVQEMLKPKTRHLLLYLSHQMAKKTKLVLILVAWAPQNQEQALVVVTTKKKELNQLSVSSSPSRLI